MVSKKGFAEALKTLLDLEFRFTVIGGSVVELALGSSDLGEDIDVFAEHPSIIFEESAYRRVAEENLWDIGQTWLGTLRLIIRAGEEEVPVEFYDNIHDFYVPELIIRRSVKVPVDELRVKMILLEDYLVLKANAGRSGDIERLKEIGRLIKRKKISLDTRKILEAASEFEEKDVILRRLRDATIL